MKFLKSILAFKMPNMIVQHWINYPKDRDVLVACNLVTMLLGDGGGLFFLGALPIFFKSDNLLAETPGAGFAGGVLNALSNESFWHS